MDCKHGFVVRSASGANRFLCGECDERFIRHPDIIRRKTEDAAAIVQELEEEKQRAWEPKTHQENAKALVGTMFPDDKKIQERIKQRPLGLR